jgi:hypothetical protein
VAIRVTAHLSTFLLAPSVQSARETANGSRARKNVQHNFLALTHGSSKVAKGVIRPNLKSPSPLHGPCRELDGAAEPEAWRHLREAVGSRPYTYGVTMLARNYYCKLLGQLNW